jgi:hypothetical protein
MYDTSEYASSRIQGTVVMLKRKPIYVEKVHRGVVSGRSLDRSPHPVHCDLDDVSVLSFELGFVNIGGTAYYLSRKAMRRDWRQGLRPQNILCVPPRGLDWSDIGDCLLHRYTSFAKAVTLVSGGHVKSMAWRQDLCLKRGGVIQWKLYDVGIIKDCKIELGDSFKFLASIIKESTHGCYEVI